MPFKGLLKLHKSSIRLHKAPFLAYFSDSVRGYFEDFGHDFPYFGFILRVLGGAQSALVYYFKRPLKGLQKAP